MIETQARVLEIESGAALVEPMEPSGCSACGTKGGGCGADRIGQVFTLRSKRYRVLDPRGSKVGEAVVIGVADGAVLRAIRRGVFAAAATGFYGRHAGQSFRTAGTQRCLVDSWGRNRFCTGHYLAVVV